MILDFHTHHSLPEGVFTPLCFGIHPWNADSPLPSDDDARWQEADLIGECGLDGLRGPDVEVQSACFERQLFIAERMGKPVVVHCVREMDRLLLIRQRHHATPWVWHGFAGSLEQARQLLDKGILLSVGASLLDPRKEKLRHAVRSLAPGTFFLETDDNTSVSIRQLYTTAADILHISPQHLAALINDKYCRLLQQ